MSQIRGGFHHALTDAGVWLDDAQVVHLTADKAWTDQHPGAHLHITTLGGQS